jgi:hypothetical protein
MRVPHADDLHALIARLFLAGELLDRVDAEGGVWLPRDIGARPRAQDLGGRAEE